MAVLVLLVARAHCLALGNFRVIDSHAGLPDNSVTSIAQDADGYLWLGTFNGLCRYDGMSFMTFRNNPADSLSIISNIVNKVLPVSGGVYVGTGTGLDFYSYADGRFHRCYVTDGGRRGQVSSDVKSLLAIGSKVFFTDSGGRLCVTSGKGGREFVRVQPGLEIYSVCAFGGGMMLAAGSAGVYMLADDGRHVVASCADRPSALSKLNISYIPQTGMAYVGGGIGAGSSAYAVSRGSIRRSDAFVPSDLMDVEWYGGSTLFATDGHGIITLAGGRVDRCVTYNSDLSGNVIYALFTDRMGDLWAGAYRTGLNHYVNGSDNFTLLSEEDGSLSFNIVTAVVPVGNKIFVGLDGGGLDIYDVAARRSAVLNSYNSDLPGDNVVAMTRDGDDLWMAVYTQGLVHMSLSTGRFTLYRMPGRAQDAVNNVWCMLDDGEGNIWIGGPRLYVFNKATRSFSAVKGLGVVNCSAIAQGGGYVWLSSKTLGIYKIDKRKRSVAAHYMPGGSLGLPSRNVGYIYVDRGGTVWFSVSNVGLYSFNPVSGARRRYGAADGLTSPNVVSMVEDGGGNMWLGTDGGGLFRRNASGGGFTGYDGIADIPLTFTYSAALRYGGNLYFGTTRGLLTFNPVQARLKRNNGKVGFTGLTLMDGGKSLYLHGDSPQVKLAYDENFFVVSFSVPELRAPNNVRFSCRLDGLEDKWRDLPNLREVAYTNVPPGHYTLYVRRMGADGQWGEPSTLGITVTPPWWSTAWAIALWIVLGLAIVVSVVAFLLNEQKIKQRMRITEIEKDATKRLSEAKLNFYANITHELRTPVFLIMAQLEELINTSKSAACVPSAYLKMMYKSAQKLNKLITRVLDFRRMDSGKLSLNLRRGDVIEFCKGLVEEYSALCEQKDISFSFVHDNGPLELNFDPERLEIILSNLVSNAYKYTKEGGSVQMSVRETPTDVVFAVKDNGIGILPDMQQAIFEDFFRTARGKAQSGGDGIGLSFVRELVALHKGSIHVESTPDVGSTFIFNIPKGLGEPGWQPGEDGAKAKPKSKRGRKPKAAALADDGKDVVCDGSVTSLPNDTADHSILIIDDERETVNLLERMLSQDFKIYKAFNGEDGLEQARQYRPDIILCDIMMPKMDGMELLSQLRNDPQLQAIKVIIFTAKATEEDMVQALDAGADDYVTKPISLRYLRKRIDRLVAQLDTMDVIGAISLKKKDYNKEDQVFLMRCREVIDEYATNPDFNVDFLADKLAMSHSTLYKKVKQLTDMSLIEFVNEYKIYKAIQMFKHGIVNIEKVSTMCGFNDVKNFRILFKRKMNISPKDYIRGL